MPEDAPNRARERMLEDARAERPKERQQKRGGETTAEDMPDWATYRMLAVLR